MKSTPWHLDPDRYFDPDPTQRKIARELYETVKELPLICPHGHVDPGLFARPEATFGTPVELLIIPDHYIFRMLYSQGIPLEALGIPRKAGQAVEQDPRKIWQTFVDHFYLFRGTPSGMWLAQELSEVFDVQQRLSTRSAQEIYDQIEAKLASPEFSPRALYERFNIEVLCTTDAATSPLEHHRAIRASGWPVDIRPTFRPDALINLDTPGWREQIEKLSQASGMTITSYAVFIQALEERRQFFRSMGATASDHGVSSALTTSLSLDQAERIFQKALHGEATSEDARVFTAHMLVESARMSVDDGLVMQIHAGSVRNHNAWVYEHFGPDMGADIPQATEFTHNLQALLNRFGNDPRLTLIIFTLDESTYSRELAPLAGHYPALRLGPPWWFHDSVNGIQRYLDQVLETAGLYNLAGFNDDTRAFLSIPARHDVWRRVSANWIAGKVAGGILDLQDAGEMLTALAYDLAKSAYKLDGSTQGTGQA
jgi:glucuronate isomerase